MSQNNTLEIELKESGYAYLGYANSWINYQTKKVEWPERVHKCIKNKDHNRTTISGSQGIDSMSICDICKIYWKYDSSD